MQYVYYNYTLYIVFNLQIINISIEIFGFKSKYNINLSIIRFVFNNIRILTICLKQTLLNEKKIHKIFMF